MGARAKRSAQDASQEIDAFVHMGEIRQRELAPRRTPHEESDEAVDATVFSRQHLGEAIEEGERRIVPRPGSQLQEARRSQRTVRSKGVSDLALRHVQRHAQQSSQIARRRGVR